METSSNKKDNQSFVIISFLTGILAFVADVLSIFSYFDIRLNSPLNTQTFPSPSIMGITINVNTLTALTGTLGFYSASVLGIAFWKLAYRQSHQLGRLISWLSFHSITFLPLAAFWYGTFWALRFDFLIACLAFPSGFFLFELIIGCATWTIAAALYDWKTDIYRLIVQARGQILLAVLAGIGLWIIVVILLAVLNSDFWAVIGIVTVLLIVAGTSIYLRYPELMKPILNWPRLLKETDIPPLLHIEIQQRLGLVEYITSAQLSKSHPSMPAHKIHTILKIYEDHFRNEDVVLIEDQCREYGSKSIPKTPSEILESQRLYRQLTSTRVQTSSSSHYKLREIETDFDQDPFRFLLSDSKWVTDYSKWEDKPTFVLTKKTCLETRPWRESKD